MHESFLTAKEVCELFSVKRTKTLYDWMKADPKFPRPIRLSPRCVRWRLTSLLEWVTEVERALRVVDRLRAESPDMQHDIDRVYGAPTITIADLEQNQ